MSSIDNTFVGYAFENAVGAARIETSLARVAAHYGELYSDALIADRSGDDQVGMALWRRDDPRLEWPLWARAGALSVATTNPPTGWESLGDDPGSSDAIKLGSALRDQPTRLIEINPPFLLGIHDAGARSLTIVNDFLGAARLFELQAGGCRVWSNRLGALFLFAGERPVADEAAWAVHAATGWFLGDYTPALGAKKVASGSVVTAEAGPDRILRVSSERTDAVRRLVEPRRSRLGQQADRASREALGLARDLARAWKRPPTINLSGGRDSRVAAAGVVAAGIDATYRTMDIEPGEADLVRELLDRLPVPVEHNVTDHEASEPDDELLARVRASHLVHDGLANPMSAVRGAPRLPWDKFPAPLVTGHGGELGHGKFYSQRNGATLRTLRKGGDDAIVARLERSGRQRHSAASEDAYGAYVAELRRTVAEGRSYGIEGPPLLDWFIFSQRVSFRSALGARNDRYATCVSPAFVRGCFDLAPGDRLKARLHHAVIDRLVPEWKGFPFFDARGGRLRPMNRTRVWDRPGHADELERVITEGESWHGAFDAERVLEMWEKTRNGEAHTHFEAIFMRIAWRAAFDDHLELLGERATAPVGSPPALHS